jgi:hypothetical protein
MISFKNNFEYKEYAHNNNFIEVDGNLWVEYASSVFVRYPYFVLDEPDKKELEYIFKNTNAKVISYSVKSENDKNNGWLYVCKKFDVSNLKDTFKRNVRKAEKVFSIRMLSPDEVETLAYQPYCDTRKRLGLNDYTKDHFLKSFSKQNLRKNSCIVGAFAGEQLAAFSSILMYKDFIEIGLYSANDYLKDRPNDYLVYNVLNTALNIDKLKLVSYGLSSIQEKTSAEGLHQFKLKCGFEAVPIQRKFVVNPKYKWLINPLTKTFVKVMLTLFPTNIKLRKINGILNNV